MIKRYLSYSIILLLLGFIHNVNSQDQSVLSNGKWYKIRVQESGVYRLTRSDLASMGFDVNTLDPRNLKIFGNPGGTLHQAIDDPRPKDLIENAILVQGQSDGILNEQDGIIFYAEGPDTFNYSSEGDLTYKKNIYSDYNFYFITIGDSNGKRVSTAPNLGNSFNEVNTYNTFKHHELKENNLLKSGRKWYGERFDFTTAYDINFSFNDIAQGSFLKVTSKVMAQSFASSQFTINVNGQELGTQNMDAVPDFRQRIYRYSIKGKENKETFVIGADNLPNRNTISLTYQYEKNNSGQSIGFLDYVTIEAIEKLRWDGDSFIFRSLESLNNSNSTFKINNAANDLQIWDISNYGNASSIDYSFSQSQIQFGANTSTLKEYVIFKPNELPKPELIGEIANQNLQALSPADFLIITHPEFLSEAKRLANFRMSHDNLLVHVVDINQVYNEFSSGRQDVTAIRDFAKQHYDKGQLKYLLLFGRGSYDYFNTLSNNTNFVPIYQSRNSLHPLDTYGSDDYYGFLENGEGEWSEQSTENPSLDIGVGRLPVTSAQEAKGVVDKLIAYSTNNESYGEWRNKVTFVADDGDINLHQKQADQLTQFVDTTYSSFVPEKLYLDAFKQESNPGGETSPEATEALIEAVESGALIVNYTGHGGEVGWMQERVLRLDMIDNWRNKNNLPLFVTATCEFSRHDDPSRISGGEKVLTNPIGGGISIVSTCRPVSSSSNFELNKAFYNTVFAKENNNYLRLGDILRLTKNSPSVNKVGNRNFALLGDPSLKLAYPENSIEITSILNNGQESDTLNALSKVKITGVVKSGATINNSFNGKVKATFFDKEVLLTTLGNENPPFNYFDKENLIFNGEISVANGRFSMEFLVPKGISYQYDFGKLSLYAIDDSQNIDANGAKFITVGGSSSNPGSDTKGPDITLYIGDTLTNRLTDIASDTRLYAYLKDENGINISGFGIGNNLTAVLDDSIEFIMNKHFVNSLDTYKEGWVTFPIKNLSAGQHTIKVRAWDTYNNPSEKLITFEVADKNRLVINDLNNYPNPVTENTRFVFRHNRPGEDLEVELSIINRIGRMVFNYKYFIEQSPGFVELPSWDAKENQGDKLRQGLYIYRLVVRSVNNGATDEQHRKLILIN